MMPQGHVGGTEYREQLADIVSRARSLETRARNERKLLNSADPRYVRWISIERRYATVRGNAEHLLQICSRKQRRPFRRLMRLWNPFKLT